MSGWSNVISPTVTVGASSSICYGDDTNAPSVQWSQHAPSDMLKVGDPLTDHDHSATIPIHCASSDFTSYIIQPITLLVYHFNSSFVPHPLSHPSHTDFSLHPIFVIPGVGYRMMGETTVSPLLISYSPINSACGTLLFSFSHPPSCCRSPITCLKVLVNYLAKQYSVLSLPLCSSNRLQSPRHGIH